MKKFLPLVVCLVITAKLFAQDCSQFVYMRKGKTVETTGFNQGSAVMFKTESHVLDVSTAGGMTTATVETEHFDKDGKSTGKKTLKFKCNGGSFFVDMSSMGSDNFKFSASNMEYPANMKVGDHLADMDMKIQFSRPGKPAREMNAKVINRQVLAKESVTTPAGTWTALKISYQTTMDMPGMPAGMSIPPQTTTEWYVPNFGTVQWNMAMGMTMKVTSIH